MADFIKVGTQTPPVAIFKSESHKLHHAFPLEDSEKVVQGQPVVLLSTGTVRGFKNGDSLSAIIGFAVTESSHPAYQPSRQHGPIDITVAVSGHAIVHAISGAALVAGPVKPTGGLDSTGKYAEYIQATPGTSGSMTPGSMTPGSITEGSFVAPDTYTPPVYTPGVYTPPVYTPGDGGDRVIAIALNPAGDSGELLQVLVM